MPEIVYRESGAGCTAQRAQVSEAILLRPYKRRAALADDLLGIVDVIGDALIAVQRADIDRLVRSVVFILSAPALTSPRFVGLRELKLIYGNNRYIPDVFRIDYTAGFGKNTDPLAVSPAQPKLDKIPGIIKDVVGKLAAAGPLNIAGDLLGGAGIASQSIGIDGLSQSSNRTQKQLGIFIGG